MYLNSWIKKLWHVIENKKFLLHERKRHTALRIASTPSAVLSWMVPHPWPGCTLSWGTPHPNLARGGYPIPDRRDLGPDAGVPPGKDKGLVEVLWDEDGVPPLCGQTHTCKNSTFLTLNKVQKIGKAENSDQSFIMIVCENFILGFWSVWRKLLVVPSNT